MSRSEEDTQKSTSTRERLNLTLEKTGALVGAVDQGTSSSRFMVFSAETGHLVASHQIPVRTRASQPGWSEQDPRELLETVITCIDQTVLKLRKLNIDPTNIRAIGITNQRETTIVWDKTTGEPLYPAILWNDNRTEQILNRILKRSNTSDDTTTQSATSKDECNRKRGKREKARENENANQSINQNEGDHVTKFTDELHGPKNPRLHPQHGLKNPRLFEFQLRCGLPFSTYFSALKLVWLRENLPSVRDSMASGSLLFGTVDSWLIWNLTGGVKKGVHMTDVTNASRTLLMNLHTLEWDPYLLEFFHLPPSILPEIRTSSEHYGELAVSSLKGFPLTGCLGDQQAALLGQHCTLPGQTKTTYGTGCFLLTNIGTSPIIQPGLLTTVAYKFGQEPACFAIEGSIGQAGSALALLESWGIKNQMETATTSAGVLALPSFSGLLAPRWRPDMRGTFTGISSFTLPEHLVFATMEAIAFQVKELTDCISKTGIQIEEILVDGGLSQSSKLMQLQADILGKPVVRPNMLETTALGAALAAGKGVGLWDNIQGGLPVWKPTTSDRFSPAMQKEEREDAYERWNKFVEASLSYQEQSQASQEQYSEETSESVDTLWPAKLFTLSTLAIYMLADVLAGKW